MSDTSDVTSILKGTVSESDALKQLFLPKLISGTKGQLDNFSKFVDAVEDVVKNGSVFSVGKTKVNVTPKMLAQEAPAVFKELKHISEAGRKFLTIIGFEGPMRTAPSTLVGNAGRVLQAGSKPRGAAAMVQPVEQQTPGQPPLSGAVIKAVK